MWNVWKQLFGGARHPSVANNIKGDGEFGFAVVGESNYQRELEEIVGGKSEDSCEEYVDALLVPEPTHPHDPSAVYVEIAGRKVGYLASHIAHHYLKRLESLGYSGSAKCAAVIVGGWCRGDGDEGSFGVKLDMTWPVSVN